MAAATFSISKIVLNLQSNYNVSANAAPIVYDTLTDVNFGVIEGCAHFTNPVTSKIEAVPLTTINRMIDVVTNPG